MSQREARKKLTDHVVKAHKLLSDWCRNIEVMFVNVEREKAARFVRRQ